MVTDLPLPEPPRMTSESPGRMERSTPSSTLLRPKRFLTPRNSIFGTPFTRGLSGENQRRHQIIRRKNQNRRRHHRIGGCSAHSLRPTFGIKSIVAAHQRDDETEHG